MLSNLLLLYPTTIHILVTNESCVFSSCLLPFFLNYMWMTFTCYHHCLFRTSELTQFSTLFSVFISSTILHWHLHYSWQNYNIEMIVDRQIYSGWYLYEYIQCSPRTLLDIIHIAKESDAQICGTLKISKKSWREGGWVEMDGQKRPEHHMLNVTTDIYTVDNPLIPVNRHGYFLLEFCLHCSLYSYNWSLQFISNSVYLLTILIYIHTSTVYDHYNLCPHWSIISVSLLIISAFKHTSVPTDHCKLKSYQHPYWLQSIINPVSL